MLDVRHELQQTPFDEAPRDYSDAAAPRALGLGGVGVPLLFFSFPDHGSRPGRHRRRRPASAAQSGSGSAARD